MRKEELITGQIYHIFSKSIARYVIFNENDEFIRMKKLLNYYEVANPKIKFSKYIIMTKEKLEQITVTKTKLVQIIAYCLMPTHIHLILKQLEDNGISRFMNKILNAYTRYFNLRHMRKGPLWESRFKNVCVQDDEQLIHLTRYIHLNPTTAFLTTKPEEWKHSSYKEYVGINSEYPICDFKNIINFKIKEYIQFVHDNIGYQRELAKLKKIILE